MTRLHPNQDRRHFPADKLVVVNVPVFQLDKKHPPKWWHKLMNDRELFVAETCSRVLMVTNRDHWEGAIADHYPEFVTRCMTQQTADEVMVQNDPNPFLKQTNPCFLKSEGWDAYRYLLEVSTGLHSAEPGEEQIGGQILEEEYTKHKTNKHGTRKTWLEPIIQALRHDVRQVREIVNVHHAPKHEDTVKRLLNLPKNSNVLILGDTWEHISDMLHSLKRGNGEKVPAEVDVVSVLDDTDETRGRLQIHINDHIEKHKCPGNTTVASFDDVVKTEGWLPQYDAIIVASPIGKAPQKENEFINAWKACPAMAKPRLAITRFLKDYEDEIMPFAELKQMKDAVVMLPDKILENLQEEQVRHARIMQEGGAATRLCTRLRQETHNQHHPNGCDLHLGYDEYIRKNPLERYASWGQLVRNRRANVHEGEGDPVSGQPPCKEPRASL